MIIYRFGTGVAVDSFMDVDDDDDNDVNGDTTLIFDSKWTFVYGIEMPEPIPDAVQINILSDEYSIDRTFDIPSIFGLST
jgi:hypothetical protein